MAKLQFTIGGVSYPAIATKKALEFIGKRWRKNARISLKMQGRVNTGALYNSMRVFVGANQHAMYVNITPDVDYWEYVDKGVQGASKNIFPKQSDSPFKFGSGRGKPGLRGAIDRWTTQKNIQGTRDAQGRFVPRKSIVFAITRAIWHRGLKPSLFISGTWKRLRIKALNMLAVALGEDMANALRQSLNKDKNLETT
ncbi:hypothetical protein [Acinetobacter sp.]|uniref:hypothetical protein n=1 Tax=Acinetobacter sp. TaxID=472 RepID=UPI000C0B1DAD|nr:hypothetical protein [Acinetobacter sp.]MAK30308.1 hypothetical protein [Acinetobacter sp.]|tara:strand:+ start:2643 stop:3233 length:591 start_codon:yes stop_codon:yes gene_type:complete